MKISVINFSEKVWGRILVIGIFALGLWLVIIRPMGSQLDFVPGDLGDARFNNFVLEHFFLWLLGIFKGNWLEFLSPGSSLQFISKLYANYWNATFFYPYRMTIAFSDNLLGSAPFYVAFRFMGMDMLGAFQIWSILGAALNFIAAAYVLKRLKLTYLAVAVGAFFFAFGLPMLAQESHPQLIYRFCIPLACYTLFELSQRPTQKKLISLVFWCIWQFYLAIYLGLFLVLILFAMYLLLPIVQPKLSLKERLLYWPKILLQIWETTNFVQRVFTLLSISTLLFALLSLFWPYYWVSKVYNASRSWKTVSPMLPRPESYLLADHSLIWGAISTHFSVPMQHEHQLFSGISISIMLLLSLALIPKIPNKLFVLLNLGTLVLLVVLTLYFNKFSFYKYIFSLPGFNGLRAISRIQLVLMWPIAVLAASTLDVLVQKPNWLYSKLLVYPLVGLMIIESILFQHVTFSKAEAKARLDRISSTIPAVVPKNPILIIGGGQDPAYKTEVDAMLVAQQLGWPILNGYSGIAPPGYSGIDPHGFWGTYVCSDLPKRILLYIEYANMGENAKDFYLEMIQRVVPIGFQDCEPSWWVEMPVYEDLH